MLHPFHGIVWIKLSIFFLSPILFDFEQTSMIFVRQILLEVSAVKLKDSNYGPEYLAPPSLVLKIQVKKTSLKLVKNIRLYLT